MAFRADSTMALWTEGMSPQVTIWVGPAGGVLSQETLGFELLFSGDLLWLPDGRLVAWFQRNTWQSGGEYVYLVVRSAAGAWTRSLLGTVADNLGPVFTDPRVGQSSNLYSGRLRSRDLGVSWAKNPSGQVMGLTTADAGTTLRLFTNQSDPNLGTGVSLISTNGGDTGTPITGFPTTVDKVEFHPATPTSGAILSATNVWTSTNGGDSWSLPPGFPTGLQPSSIGFAGTYWYVPGARSIDNGVTWTAHSQVRTHCAGDGVTAACFSNTGGLVALGSNGSTTLIPVAGVAGTADTIAPAAGFTATTGVVYLRSKLSGVVHVYRSANGLTGPWTEVWTDTIDYKLRADPFDPTGNRLSIAWFYSATGGR